MQYVMEQLCPFGYSSSENTQWISIKFDTGSVSLYSFLSLYSTSITINVSLEGYNSIWIFQIRKNLIQFDEIRFWPYIHAFITPLLLIHNNKRTT
jgi:hypothetical protein